MAAEYLWTSNKTIARLAMLYLNESSEDSALGWEEISNMVKGVYKHCQGRGFLVLELQSAQYHGYNLSVNAASVNPCSTPYPAALIVSM